MTFILNTPTQFINNFDGAKIAVYHKPGMPSSKSILFIHGNSISSLIFEKQFASKEFADINLFAFDFPGHGKSENALDPEQSYSVHGLVKTLEFVIESLQLKDAVLVANSLGADLVLNSAKISSWGNSLITFSHAPLSVITDFYEAIKPSPMFGFFYNPIWSEENIETVAKELSSEQSIGVDLRPVLARTDTEFRRVFSAAMQQGMLRDEFAVIREFKNPVCVCYGQNERILNIAYFDSRNKDNFWKNKVQIIEGGSHLLSLDASEKFNDIISSFLKTT